LGWAEARNWKRESKRRRTVKPHSAARVKRPRSSGRERARRCFLRFAGRTLEAPLKRAGARLIWNIKQLSRRKRRDVQRRHKKKVSRRPLTLYITSSVPPRHPSTEQAIESFRDVVLEHAREKCQSTAAERERKGGGLGTHILLLQGANRLLSSKSHRYYLLHAINVIIQRRRCTRCASLPGRVGQVARRRRLAKRVVLPQHPKFSEARLK
jgi:hypothetical protein